MAQSWPRAHSGAVLRTVDEHDAILLNIIMMAWDSQRLGLACQWSRHGHTVTGWSLRPSQCQTGKRPAVMLERCMMPVTLYHSMHSVKFERDPKLLEFPKSRQVLAVTVPLFVGRHSVSQVKLAKFNQRAPHLHRPSGSGVRVPLMNHRRDGRLSLTVRSNQAGRFCLEQCQP